MTTASNLSFDNLALYEGPLSSLIDPAAPPPLALIIPLLLALRYCHSVNQGKMGRKLSYVVPGVFTTNGRRLSCIFSDGATRSDSITPSPTAWASTSSSSRYERLRRALGTSRYILLSSMPDVVPYNSATHSKYGWITAFHSRRLERALHCSTGTCCVPYDEVFGRTCRSTSTARSAGLLSTSRDANSSSDEASLSGRSTCFSFGGRTGGVYPLSFAILDAFFPRCPRPLFTSGVLP
mmetsp:Transcript_33236/g.73331  ORF Transcript_33236/g.73331 Transcript_33236/m.73331 type:complete len:237 (-) Transcript_33236:190-900(-)